MMRISEIARLETWVGFWFTSDETAPGTGRSKDLDEDRELEATSRGSYTPIREDIQEKGL